MALDENSKTFIIYVVFLNLVPRVHPDSEAQIAFLLTKKIKIPNKYSDFANVFSKKKGLDATRAHQAQWVYHWLGRQ